MDTSERRSIVVPSSVLFIKEMKRNAYMYTYMYILSNCTIQNCPIRSENKTINTLLGVYRTSYAKLAKISNANTPIWTKTFLKVLMENRLIGIRKEKKQTIILIPNYDLYLLTSKV